MSISSVSPSFPVSSGEIPILNLERLEMIARRHAWLNDFLREEHLDGLLIRQPANFSWFTAGGDNTCHGNSQHPVAALLLTPDARVILCNNIDSGQLFDQELMGLGFLLKERPWTESPDILQQDVCRGRSIASDSVIPEIETRVVDLAAFRMTLEQQEIEALRELSRDLAHALEATARNFEKGATEAEIAGHLSHRLIKRQIEPVCLQVLADGQGWRYRHWSYGKETVERSCVLSATGRRKGLHSGASRTVSMGPPTEELQRTHGLATLLLATGIHFSQAGWPVEETWKRVLRIYEKFDVPDEWRCARQADFVGYSAMEQTVVPASAQVLKSGMALHWHPSVRGAFAGDTMLVTPHGQELLTTSQNWPTVAVRVKDTTLELPSLLIREFAP